MADISLSQTETYEWYGSFWFPSNNPNHKEYSGKLSYSPSDGIRLSLSRLAKQEEIKGLFNSHRHPITRKIMHGFVRDKNSSFHITLIDVFLGIGFTLSGSVSERASGSAQGLVIDALLNSEEINGISVEYDPFFESAILRNQFREADILAFAKGESVTLDSGVEICLRDRSSNRIIYGADDFCDSVSSFNEETTALVRGAISRALEGKNESLFMKDKINFVVWFKKKDSNLSTLLKTEEIWSGFWSLVIDHAITINRSWIDVSYTDGTGSKSCAYIASRWKHEQGTEEPRHIWHLKLNFYKFGGSKQSLLDISDVIQKWFSISENPNWNPVIRSVQRALKAKDAPIDSPVYVALIAEIQTFLDITGKTPQNADTLINFIATQKWKGDLSAIMGKLSTNPTLGCAVSNVRNAIVHPISYEKRDGGKWKELSTDYISLLKIYALLSGLLVKAVWSEIASLKEEELNGYIDDFIASRTFSHIDYNE